MRFSGREVETAVSEKRPSWFRVFLHQKSVVDAVPDETAGKAFKAALKYFEDRTVLDLDPLAAVVFAGLKSAIDESYSDFVSLSEKNRMNVMKRWNKNNTTVYDRMRPNTKHTDTDTETDTETEAETDIIKAGKPPNKKFVPPTLDEVKAYVKERDSVVDAEYFIDFYASKGWKVGRETMKDWKAAFRRAEKWDCWGKISKPDIKDAESYKTDESEGFYFDY